MYKICYFLLLGDCPSLDFIYVDEEGTYYFGIESFDSLDEALSYAFAFGFHPLYVTIEYLSR